jgi:acyl carrier protein
MDPIQTNEVKDMMVEYFVDHAGVSKEALASGDVKIESLGIDSLSMIEMLWVVEEKTGVHIDDMHALKDMTLDMLAEFIGKLVPRPQVAA